MAETYGYDKTPTPAIDYDVNKVPAEIRKRTEWVKSKFTGEDVAEAYRQAGDIAGLYAGEAKRIAEQTQYRQDAVEQYNDQMIAEMTDKDVISAPELIESRDGEVKLSTRLDRDKNETDSRLMDLAINVKYPPEPLTAAKGDGETEDTSTIQAIIDYASENNYSKILIPDGVYMIDGIGSGHTYAYGKGLLIPSNITLSLSDNAVLRQIPTHSDNYKIVNLMDVENVTIEGGTIQGDRYTHLGTTGEWGYCLNIEGCTNVQIKNTKLIEGWGDGINIGASPYHVEPRHQDYSKNILLENILCDDNRRQGISVISVDGLTGRNVTLSNTSGTAPSSGIDFEPNKDFERINNVHFDGLNTFGNEGPGLLIYLLNLTSAKDVNMVFNNFVSRDNGTGLSIIRCFIESNGRIVFNEPIIERPQTSGVYMKAVSSKFSKIIFRNPYIVDYNYSKSQDAITSSGISLSVYNNDNVPTNFRSGNLVIERPEIKEFGEPLAYDIILSNQTTTLSDYDLFEDIEVTGLKTTRFFGHNFSKKSKVEVDRLPYTTISGTLNIPQYSSAFYPNLDVSGSTPTTLNLNKLPLNHSLPYDITIKYGGGAGEPLIIRATEGRLYPLKYSTGTEKGIKIETWLNQGAYVRLRFSGGNWNVVEIVGDWVAEV